MIYNLFHQHSSGHGRIIGSWSSLFRSLKLVVSKIDILKSAMLWRSYIVSVSTTLFAFDQYFTEDFIYRDHLGDKVSSHIEWAIEGLLYAAKSLAIDHANKDLCTWALDYILGVYDRLEYLPSYYSDVLGVDFICDIRAAFLGEMGNIKALQESIKQTAEEDEQYHLIQKLSDIYIQKGLYEDRIALLHKYISLYRVRMDLIHEQMKLGQYKEALALSRARDKTRIPSHINEIFVNIELECWEKLGRKEEVIAIYKKEFKTASGRRALECYNKLKSLCSSEEWDKIKVHLLQKNKSLDNESLIQIYIEEQRQDEAFALIVKSEYFKLRYILKYGHLFSAEYTTDILKNLEIEVRRCAATAANPHTYELVAHILTYMTKLERGSSLVRDLIIEFRTLYKRRPNMMKKLNEVIIE